VGESDTQPLAKKHKQTPETDNHHSGKDMALDGNIVPDQDSGKNKGKQTQAC
jgi:hypothetical protein